MTNTCVTTVPEADIVSLKRSFSFLDLPQESPYGEGRVKHLWSVISFREMPKRLRTYNDSK